MKVSDLKLSPRRERRRAGRGISAGRGKTAGRGTKGQNSRSGGQRNPGFEGGQNPLFQRLPKQRGFRSHRPKLQVIKTSRLATLRPGVVTAKTLLEAGLISNPKVGAKLLFDGKLDKRYEVSLQAASSKAVEAVIKAGGSFKSVPLIAPKDDKAAKPAKSTSRAKS